MKKIYSLMMGAALLMGATACGSKTENKTEEQAETQDEIVVSRAEGVIKLTDDNLFRPTTEVAQPTVLDFNAVWCVPCKKLTPAYDQVAAKYPGTVAFYSVDIDNNQETAKAFGVESIPTVIIMMPNGVVERHVGLNDFLEGSDLPADATNEQLTEVIAQHLDAMIANLLSLNK